MEEGGRRPGRTEEAIDQRVETPILREVRIAPHAIAIVPAEKWKEILALGTDPSRCCASQILVAVAVDAPASLLLIEPNSVLLQAVRDFPENGQVVRVGGYGMQVLAPQPQ